MKQNPFQNRHYALAKVVAISLSVIGGALPAKALVSEKSCLRPNWSQAEGRIANESYLVQTGVKPERTLNDEIFDPGASRALRNEYETRVYSEDAQSNAGLTSRVDEKSRFAVMHDFARRVVDTMSRIRLKAEGDKLAKVAENSNMVGREPVAVAVLAASLYSGRSMDFKVFNGTRVSSRIVLKDRQGSLTMPIPQTGITSTLAYNTDDNLNAQLSKQLTTHVSAAVGTAQKGSAQLVYSVSF